jgi:hypothetical protein
LEFLLPSPEIKMDGVTNAPAASDRNTQYVLMVHEESHTNDNVCLLLNTCKLWEKLFPIITGVYLCCIA